MATAGASPFDDDPCVGRVVVGEDELRERIVALGKEITADYSGRTPLLVGVLKGAFMFMSDLARAVDLPVQFVEGRTFILSASLRPKIAGGSGGLQVMLVISDTGRRCGVGSRCEERALGLAIA